MATVHADAAAPGTKAKRLTLLACILGSSIVFIDGTVVNVALPAIQHELGGGLAAQQWIVDAYLLTLGSLILVGGSLGDLFGERKVFALGVGLFGLMSIACAAAPTANTLIVARGFQGIAGALLTPASLAVIVSTFEGEERGAAIGTWTAWSGISTVVGPLLGGWLIGFASWRWIFLLNVPLAIGTVALVLVAVPGRETNAKDAHVDFVGGLLCVAGLGGTVFAFIEQPRLGWSSPAIWGSLLAGVALFAAFLVFESRAAHPMLPLRLFARRNFSVTNVETLAVYGGLSTLAFFLVLYLQQIVGYSPFQSGLALLPITIVLFLLSRHVGRLSMRMGPRLFMGSGPIVAGLGLLLLLRMGRGMSYWVDLLPAVILFAFGLSLTVAPLTSTVLAGAGQGDAGIASGVNNAVARVGGLIAIAVVGLAVANGSNRLTTQGFHTAILITSALVVAGGVVGALGIRNR